ncbi:MAG: Ig-like domain-containing protein [Anaerotruncus sp.]|nr:MAG: Ig-like domain-containing protein [Anaerotruncus sp.]
MSFFIFFYRLGGYVGLGGVKILNSSAEEVGDYISVKVGATANYKKAKCQLKYELKPKSAMYSKIEWSSSDPKAVSVNNNGLCKPVSNSACHATITVTVTDYFGNEVSKSVEVAFAKKLRQRALSFLPKASPVPRWASLSSLKPRCFQRILSANPPPM